MFFINEIDWDLLNVLIHLFIIYHCLTTLLLYMFNKENLRII